MQIKPIITCELFTFFKEIIFTMLYLFIDSGSCPLFRSLESQILNAIPLDTCEWRRTFQRPTKHVRLEAQTQQFNVSALERYKSGDWSILEHPILHIFVTECNVC